MVARLTNSRIYTQGINKSHVKIKQEWNPVIAQGSKNFNKPDNRVQVGIQVTNATKVSKKCKYANNTSLYSQGHYWIIVLYIIQPC